MGVKHLVVPEFGPCPVPDGFANIGQNRSAAKDNKGFGLQHLGLLVGLVRDEDSYALPMPEANKP
jgi:hypothetical protein